jgi:hypothetical protein
MPVENVLVHLGDNMFKIYKMFKNNWGYSAKNNPKYHNKQVISQNSKYVYNLKKVESASVATALAKYDLPVPGGP